MQTVFPTGTTIYQPDKCFNGLTIYPSAKKDVGAVLIDMNGHELRNWPQFNNYMVNLLPNGSVLGGQTGRVNEKYDHMLGADDLVQESWDGEQEWRFFKADQMNRNGEKVWVARQNHDVVREGCPVGYYVPGQAPAIKNAKTLFLSYRTGEWPEVTRDYLPRATRMVEVSWDGDIVWEWMPAENFEQFGWSAEAKNALMRRCRNQNGVFQNTCSYVGPNKWFDAGDERFHPENIITDDRATMIYIIEKKTGDIVWQIGPYYDRDPALQKIECVIGPHHAHIIPEGLPGAGNILVFDNGGAAGYGAPNPGAPDGTWNTLRDHSRVLEINPVSLEIVWQFTALEQGFAEGEESRFYSRYQSGAQRLPNGNTLITESRHGRIIEVTTQCEIVWEYVSPHNLLDSKMLFASNAFRGYRVPYDWVPQVEASTERAVIPPPNGQFRITPMDDKA